MNKQKIIIIGAGYGGIRMLTELSRCEGIELLLIDKNSYHYLQTDVYDYIASQVTLSDIAIDLYTLCSSFANKVTFIHEEVLEIDFSNNQVMTSFNHYLYNHLILASGGQTLMPSSIEGLRENFHGIKSLENALHFKQKFEYFIYKKIENEGKYSLESNFNIVIAGSGLSGVEIAAEMANYAREFYKGGYLCSGISIILVSSTQTPLASNSSFMQENAIKRLQELEIKVIEKARIVKVSKDTVWLDNGEKLSMNFLIWTAGITSSDLILKMQAAKNKKGQLEVDEFFRLKEHKNVFAIGDNAALFDPITKKLLPPTAQSAQLSADYVAYNLKRILTHNKPKIKSIKLWGVFASLGGKYGCGEFMNFFKTQGFKAYLLKKMIERFYRIPLQSRCRLGLKKMKKF